MMTEKISINQYYLRWKLDYDSSTGVFTYLQGRNKGKVAGVLSSHGYLKITLRGVQYYCHRLAWFWTHDYWPNDNMCVDHINSIRTDNRFINLRLVKRGENPQNIHKCHRSNKATGVLGVYPTPSGKFIARIQFENKQMSLGCFPTVEEASMAYKEAKRGAHLFYEHST
jgi:hypothetical protein